MPFLLFSLGAIIYAYFFGYKNFSKQVGIIASLIFSFSLLFVYYAPIARMYISGVFFSIGLLYYFFEIFYNRSHKKINYLLFGLFALLSSLNQHINALFAFTICVSGLLFLTKNNYQKYIITCLCIIAAYLPHIQITLYQLGIGGIGFEQGGWLTKPTLIKLIDFIKILLGTGNSYVVFLLLISTSYIFNRQFIFNKKQIYLVTIFLLNFFIVYFYSIYRASVYQHSVMLFSSVTLVFFVTSFLNVKNKYAFIAYCIIIISLFFYKTYYKKNYYHQCVFNIYEYQFKRTNELKNKYGISEVYPIYFDCDTFMKKIYFKKYNSHFDCKISSDSITLSLYKFSNFISHLNCNYIVLASSFPTYQAITKQYFPYLIENTQTQGLNFKVFSKLNPNNNIVNDDVILNYASNSNKGNYTFSDLNLPYIIYSKNEYPFQAKSSLNSITSKEGQVVLVSASFKTQNLNFNNIDLCISINENKKNSSVFYCATQSNNFIINTDSSLTLFCGAFCGSNYNKIKNNSKLIAYIWNRGKQNFTLLNFEIKTIDYCPQKWNFWE